jgi:hypothetical protein
VIGPDGNLVDPWASPPPTRIRAWGDVGKIEIDFEHRATWAPNTGGRALARDAILRHLEAGLCPECGGRLVLRRVVTLTDVLDSETDEPSRTEWGRCPCNDHAAWRVRMSEHVDADPELAGTCSQVGVPVVLMGWWEDAA